MTIRLDRINSNLPRAALTEDEWEFITGEEGILDELCGEGYFDGSRPEDRVVMDLSDASLEELPEEDQELYRAKVQPLLVAYFENPDTFPEVYAKARES